MTSSVVVKRDLESVWAFLSDQSNAPRWDRSVARAQLLSPPPLRVGSIVQTTAPSGAQLSFTLATEDKGVRISHEIAIALRWQWAILIPVFALFNRRALGADLESLRRAIDEGHDLTRMSKSER